MKFSSIVMSAAAIGMSAVGITNAQQNQAACSSVYTRKELLSLTPSEWTLYKAILTAMQRDGWFAWFSYLHVQWFSQIHGNSQFFPFHRRFVQDWERVGRMYNSGFAQPYWDEMRDYRTPATSQVLTANWIGGNGAGTNRCVTNGVQGGWTMTYPNSHCFSRNFANNGNPTSWYSPEYINSLVQKNSNMATFRSDMEYSLHGVVHIHLGGDMYQGHSPNDWAFMLHHANLDRLWWQWQQLNNHLWTMDGPNSDGGATTLNTNIAYFNEPIRNVMQLGYVLPRDCQDTPYQCLCSVAAAIANLSNSDIKAPIAAAAAIFANSPIAAQVQSLITSRQRRRIPRPAEITDAWAKMHNYNAADVARVKKEARDFVDDMAKINYESPF
ncbi:hypothetical protein BX661DRAFT_205927 [Kickxella alabastrina]|uniref:uncharacterized protein n=1 Tax=Kickxella alabastrina TaxID=61397 RepID=UPI00221F603A|nr:uncharacterized protein BX661DRAFT_205927 [Kickxella alabastrina]KAI7826313.1 hypothetical protein BX661DRAFT_205927 [Kickxella alabastrina]